MYKILQFGFLKTYFISAVLIYSLSGTSLQSQAYSVGKKQISKIKYDNFLGVIDSNQLKKIKNQLWHKNLYQNYVLDTILLSKEGVREKSRNVKVKLFIGLWCPDSRRFLPKFFKIVDFLGIDETEIEVFGTNKTKTYTPRVIGRYRIEYVPTAIIYEGNRELNRFVEFPNISVEQDFYDIIMKNDYEPFRSSE